MLVPWLALIVNNSNQVTNITNYQQSKYSYLSNIILMYSNHIRNISNESILELSPYCHVITIICY